MRYVPGSFLFLVIPIWFFSCATAPDPADGLPEWIHTFPSEEGFYVGIGNAGPEKGEDGRIIARENALTEIAAQIATTLKGQIIIEEYEDSLGARYERVSRVMEEQVAITLEEAEQVDSFYSEDRGYWVYYRISEETIDAMKSRLEREILSDIQAIQGNTGATMIENIAVLLKSRERILSSPFAGILGYIEGGERRSLLDFVERETRAILQGTAVSLESPDEVEGYARTLSFGIEVESGIETETGALPLILSVVSERGEESARIVTDRTGRASGVISLPPFSEGTGLVSLSLDREGLGIPLDFPGILLPEVSRSIRFLPRAVRLALDAEEAPAAREYRERLSTYLTGVLPEVQIEPDTSTRNIPLVRITLYFRYAPNNDLGLVFAYLRTVFSVEFEGTVSYSIETGEVKEGGLDIRQARVRVFDKMMDHLETEQNIRKNLSKVLSGEPGPG